MDRTQNPDAGLGSEAVDPISPSELTAMPAYNDEKKTTLALRDAECIYLKGFGTWSSSSS
jgi:hypothetical protein